VSVDFACSQQNTDTHFHLHSTFVDGQLQPSFYTYKLFHRTVCTVHKPQDVVHTFTGVASSFDTGMPPGSKLLKRHACDWVQNCVSRSLMFACSDVVSFLIASQ
jgi:hypothetical protein